MMMMMMMMMMIFSCGGCKPIIGMCDRGSARTGQGQNFDAHTLDKGSADPAKPL